VTPDSSSQGEIEYNETSHASSNAVDIWCRYDEYEEEWVVYPGGDQDFRYQTQEELQQNWQFVYQPLLMDREVDELPLKTIGNSSSYPTPTRSTAIPEPKRNKPHRQPRSHTSWTSISRKMRSRSSTKTGKRDR